MYVVRARDLGEGVHDGGGDKKNCGRRVSNVRWVQIGGGGNFGKLGFIVCVGVSCAKIYIFSAVSCCDS